MLVHHSDRPYEEAASDAARHARSVLGELIARGRSSAANVIDTISREVPTDHIVRASALGFTVNQDGSPVIELPAGEAATEQLVISRHALQQLCAHTAHRDHSDRRIVITPIGIVIGAKRRAWAQMT